MFSDTSCVKNLVDQAVSQGYAPTTVQQYLNDYPVDESDIVAVCCCPAVPGRFQPYVHTHWCVCAWCEQVEDGAWVNGEGYDIGHLFHTIFTLLGMQFFANRLRFDGDGYARKRGGNLFGDASTSDGQMLAPDLKAFEDEALKHQTGVFALDALDTPLRSTTFAVMLLRP